MSEYLLESEVRPDSITFLAKKEKQELYFDVWNKGEMHQIYKIKTNNVKGYKVRPPLFSIGVNERMRVYVTYQGLSDKPAKDRISVVFAHHVNIKNTVETAWASVKQMVNTPEKRAYVIVVVKEEHRRSLAEANDNQKSMMVNRSVTARPSLPPSSSSRMDPSSSAEQVAPSPIKVKAPARKRSIANSNCSTEPSDGTTEEANTKGSSKSKKRGVSQTCEATEEDPPAPPPKPRSRRKAATPPPAAESEEEAPATPKPRSRRKVATPPPAATDEEEEEAPRPVVPVAVRRKQSPARAAVAATAVEPAEDEVAEAPVAPKKARKPVQQKEEEEEEEAPPTPRPAPAKPRSRTKTQSPRPPANDDDEKIASPVRTPRKATSNPKQKTRRKSSGTMDPLEALVGDSKVVYVIQQGNNEEEEEESEKKGRKKSRDSKKKSSKQKRRKEEEEEDEE